MKRYSEKLTPPGTAGKWGVPLLLGLILLVTWCCLVVLFITNPNYAPLAIAGVIFFIVAIKVYRRARLLRDLAALERDPVNPDRHFAISRAYYFKNIFFRHRILKQLALKAFRNAVQLDLDLNILKPINVIAVLTNRHAARHRLARFIRMMAFYSTIDYMYEEYERRGFPADNLFLERSRLLLFDARQLPHIISTYELRLRELEAYQHDEERNSLYLNPFETPPAHEVSARSRQMAVLISFHHEILVHIRRLYKEYEHM